MNELLRESIKHVIKLMELNKQLNGVMDDSYLAEIKYSLLKELTK